MRVLRILNNNALIAHGDGQDVVALGLGLGHRYGKGSDMPPEAAERIFVATAAQPLDRLSAFLSELPLDHVRIAIELCEAAPGNLSRKPPEALIIAIADHISFACQRLSEGIPLENPLRWEIEQLYPRELEVGRAGLAMIRDRLNVDLPDDEAASIAMHLVNAQFTATNLHQGVRMTETITQVFDIIDRTFRCHVDRASMSASRFVTHIRYVFARLASNRPISASPEKLLSSIEDAYPEAFTCAGRVCYLLEMSFDSPVLRDERAFITLHIARLVEDTRSHPAPDDVVAKH